MAQINSFKCGICDQGFDRILNLAVHVRSHSGQRVYKCKHCDKHFSAKVQLIKHLLFCDPNKKRSCKICHKVLSGKNYFQHWKKHQKSFSCKKCYKKFYFLYQLRFHKKECFTLKITSEKNGVVNNAVMNCKDSLYYGEEDLLQHMKSHANATVKNEEEIEDSNPETTNFDYDNSDCFREDIDYNSEDSEILQENVSRMKIKGHKCFFCPKRFDTLGLLKIHLERMHNNEFNVNESLLQNWLCDICNKGFDLEKKLKAHYLTVHGKRWQSPIVYKVLTPGTDVEFPEETIYSVSNVELLNSHLKVNESSHGNFITTESTDNTSYNDRPFPCMFCTDRFEENYLKQKHIQEVHSDRLYYGDETIVSEDFNVFTAAAVRSKSKGKWGCKSCVNYFISEKSLNKHIKIIHGELKPFKCVFCEKRFKHNYVLKKHTAVHIVNKDKYTCKLCKKKFFSKLFFLKHECLEMFNRQLTKTENILKYDNNSEVVAHNRNNMDNKQRNFQCLTCGKAFYTRSHLLRHERVHSDARPHICEICGKRYKDRGDLKKHCDWIHFGKPKQAKQRVHYSCTSCDKIMTSRAALKKHLTLYHPVEAMGNELPNNIIQSKIEGYLLNEQNMELVKDGKKSLEFACDKCSMSFSAPSKLKRHFYFRHTDIKPFLCDVCPKAFKEKYDLNKHKETHSKYTNEPIPCKICNKEFYLERDLYNHMRIHDSGSSCKSERSVYKRREKNVPESFDCGTCGKSFANVHKLRRHEIVHSESRPYVCQTCGKAFKDNDRLVSHMRVHSNDRKVYPCEVPECAGRSFLSKTSLKIHMRSHTGERPFVCGFCGVGFKQKITLNIHERIHTGERPLKCDYPECNKAFTNHTSLRKHKQQHTDERPFHCHLCGKTFKDKQNLNKHLKVHLNLRPYICEYCSKGFSRSYHLKKHKEAVHKIFEQVEIPVQETSVIYTIQY